MADDISFLELCEIYLLYFDEIRGIIPFLIYPNSIIKSDKEKMRPIETHYIKWIDLKEQAKFDGIELGYGEKTYFARKFITLTQRQMYKSKNKNDNYETISIILALPNDISIFGKDLLLKLTTNIIKNFEGRLFRIVESEIAKEEIIKTNIIKKIIKDGVDIKKEVNEIIKSTCKDFFSSVIQKVNIGSIKKQKSIANIALKSKSITHIDDVEEKTSLSKSYFSESKLKSEISLRPLLIMSIKISENGREFEIIVQNNTETEFNSYFIRITYLKDFFEKEIMNQVIDVWYPQEELLFISPIIPNVNKYLFLIGNIEKKVLTKIIDLDLLKNVND